MKVEKAAENMGHYARKWIKDKRQLMLGPLKGWWWTGTKSPIRKWLPSGSISTPSGIACLFCTKNTRFHIYSETEIHDISYLKDFTLDRCIPVLP